MAFKAIIQIGNIERQVLFILSVFLFINTLSGQEFKGEKLNCEFYYDNILQKNVYKTVEVFPFYDEYDLHNFIKEIMQEIRKKETVLSHEETLWNSRVVVAFVVSEQGDLQRIQVVGKQEEDYSTMDKEVLKIINKLKCKKWNPGICNNEKVSTLVYIPLNIRFSN